MLEMGFKHREKRTCPRVARRDLPKVNSRYNVFVGAAHPAYVLHSPVLTGCVLVGAQVVNW